MQDRGADYTALTTVYTNYMQQSAHTGNSYFPTVTTEHAPSALSHCPAGIVNVEGGDGRVRERRVLHRLLEVIVHLAGGREFAPLNTAGMALGCLVKLFSKHPVTQGY